MALTSKKEKGSIAKHLETPIEFFTASPPMGPLLIKPAGMMLLYTGADNLQGRQLDSEQFKRLVDKVSAARNELLDQLAALSYKFQATATASHGSLDPS